MQGLEEVLLRYKPQVKATIEKWLPRAFDAKSLLDITGPVAYEQNPESLTQAISVPMYNMLDRGGKSWRPALLLLIAEALGKAASEVIDLTVICEVVHNGTLVIDDIEDKSTHRRGTPCSHIIYGTDIAINAGNAMYFLPLIVLKAKTDLSDSLKVKLYDLYITTMAELHMGQGYDIWWHSGKSTETITVGNYLQMCAFKTGALARLSGTMAALMSGATDEAARAVGNFCEAIGVAFQIQDDILNVVGEQFSEGKGGVGEDIREGKRTLMVIHSFHNAGKEKADRLREILNKHTEDNNEIMEAIQILKESGSVDYARAKAKELVEDAWKGMQSQLPESKSKEYLRAFATYLIERSI